MDQRPTIKPVPFILVTGFLGSGKTTLISQVLNQYANQYRFAIVQNEFAPGSLDGELLKQTGTSFDLLEVNNGSVFCACLLSDFIERLDQFLKEVQPDIILLEATGLADPSSMGEMLQSPGLAEKIFLAGSWCVVDARNFLHMEKQVNRIRHQVRIADVVWLNKVDLVCDLMKPGQRIRQLNPFADIRPSQHGHLGSWDLTAHLEQLQGVPNPLSNMNGTSEERPDIGACVVRSTHLFDRQKMVNFIEKKASLLYRMKGFVRISHNESLAIQTVMRDVEIRTPEEYEGNTELIAIGPGLVPWEFNREFQQLKSTP